MAVVAVIPTAPEATAAAVAGRVAVVIDVLRASSTIACALAAGARTVIPAATVEDARRRAAGNGSLLAGERDGVPPDGFALGNSPLEYTPDVVAGKTIILTTTNGTLAVSRCRAADATVVAAFANLRAVVTWLRARAAPVVLVCAGSSGRPAEEDVLCAGTLAEALGGSGPGVDEARALAAGTVDVGVALRDARHGRALVNIGFAADVAWCARRDHLAVVPVLGADGCITAAEGL